MRCQTERYGLRADRGAVAVVVDIIKLDVVSVVEGKRKATEREKGRGGEEEEDDRPSKGVEKAGGG